MPAFRYTMDFEYISGDGDVAAEANKGGWTESVYWTTASNAALTSFIALANARAALLPRRSRIKAIRVQQVDPSGPSAPTRVNLPGQNLTTRIADMPQSGVLLTLRSSGVTNASRHRLAAIPDPQFTAGEYKPDVGFAIEMLQFLIQLNGWRFRAGDKTVPLRSVKTIDATGLVETIEDHGYVAGDKIDFYKVKAPDGTELSGMKKVTENVTVKTFRIARWLNGAVSGGTCRKFVPIYPTISGAETTVPTAIKRPVGRPRGGYRGHRSRRRTKRLTA